MEKIFSVSLGEGWGRKIRELGSFGAWIPSKWEVKRRKPKPRETLKKPQASQSLAIDSGRHLKAAVFKFVGPLLLLGEEWTGACDFEALELKYELKKRSNESDKTPKSTLERNFAIQEGINARGAF